MADGSGPRRARHLASHSTRPRYDSPRALLAPGTTRPGHYSPGALLARGTTCPGYSSSLIPIPVMRDEAGCSCGSAERADSGGLRALGALADLELDLLVLLEGAEARTLNLGVVDEDVSGAVLGRDEAEPL